MAFIFHDEGEQYELQTAYSEEQAVPASFHLGVCNDVLIKTDGLADILNEPVGNGYARQAIASDAVDCVVAKVGAFYRVIYAQQTFTAAGGDWTVMGVDTVFLATTADNSGKLIASWPISPARNMGDGDTMDIQAYRGYA